MVKPSYIPLREAFDLAGKRLFTDEWNSEIAEDEEQRLHIDAKGYLTEAIASGEVEATFQASSYQGSSHPMTFKSFWTTGEFFTLNVADDYAHVDHVPEPVHLKFNQRQLEAFIVAQRSVGKRNTVDKEKRCKDTIIGLIAGNLSPFPKEDLIARMQSEFPGISKTAVMRARKAAIEKTGRYDLNRSGRRNDT
jgi:hypothetical protein